MVNNMRVYAVLCFIAAVLFGIMLCISAVNPAVKMEASDEGIYLRVNTRNLRLIYDNR